MRSMETALPTAWMNMLDVLQNALIRDIVLDKMVGFSWIKDQKRTESGKNCTITANKVEE